MDFWSSQFLSFSVLVYDEIWQADFLKEFTLPSIRKLYWFHQMIIINLVYFVVYFHFLVPVESDGWQKKWFVLKKAAVRNNRKFSFSITALIQELPCQRLSICCVFKFSSISGSVGGSVVFILIVDCIGFFLSSTFISRYLFLSVEFIHLFCINCFPSLYIHTHTQTHENHGSYPKFIFSPK